MIYSAQKTKQTILFLRVQRQMQRQNILSYDSRSSQNLIPTIPPMKIFQQMVFINTETLIRNGDIVLSTVPRNNQSFFQQQFLMNGQDMGCLLNFLKTDKTIDEQKGITSCPESHKVTQLNTESSLRLHQAAATVQKQNAQVGIAYASIMALRCVQVVQIPNVLIMKITEKKEILRSKVREKKINMHILKKTLQEKIQNVNLERLRTFQLVIAKLLRDVKIIIVNADRKVRDVMQNANATINIAKITRVQTQDKLMKKNNIHINLTHLTVSELPTALLQK
ncbi:UNKNOWN [Stylonychia lemnae]|uniref:Uncharacterized protein n=1 Tax=Stylonychia lemnae TaxID=5949 RepID=A0A077ZVW7_STYLE|nr:UNKNOWN [Stylonychia lemnae]|eukprot:CDW72581.1 UNKNOWN [Stylonychia lemnae]